MRPEQVTGRVTPPAHPFAVHGRVDVLAPELLAEPALGVELRLDPGQALFGGPAVPRGQPVQAQRGGQHGPGPAAEERVAGIAADPAVQVELGLDRVHRGRHRGLGRGHDPERRAQPQRARVDLAVRGRLGEPAVPGGQVEQERLDLGRARGGPRLAQQVGRGRQPGVHAGQGGGMHAVPVFLPHVEAGVQGHHVQVAPGRVHDGPDLVEQPAITASRRCSRSDQIQAPYPSIWKFGQSSATVLPSRAKRAAGAGVTRPGGRPAPRRPPWRGARGPARPPPTGGSGPPRPARPRRPGRGR